MPPYITSIERSGIEKGKKEGLLKAIGTALATKFRASGKRLMPSVRQISDLDELHALFKVILSAKTLSEVRDQLPARRD